VGFLGRAGLVRMGGLLGCGGGLVLGCRGGCGGQVSQVSCFSLFLFCFYFLFSILLI
jgi:hypothetical protein